MAAAKRTVFNPTDGPVVIDDQGHVLGGGEWAEVAVASEPVSSLLEQERLLIPDEQTVTPPEEK